MSRDSLLQGQTATYTFQLCPWFRGKYTGVLSFQGEDRDGKQAKSDSDSDPDSEYAVPQAKTASLDSEETADTNKYRSARYVR